MGTRALYTFKDGSDSVNVYKHWDGYPTGAIQHIKAAIPFAWALPRFEANEFAAAFCAGNKPATGPYSGGDVRIMPSGTPDKVASKFCADIEYRYEITANDDELVIRAFEFNGSKGAQIFAGTLHAFENSELVNA